MDTKKSKLLWIIAIPLLLIIIFGIILSIRSRGQKSRSSNLTVATVTPPPDAIASITKYLSAREDSVGADQTSPTFWLNIVKPLVTQEMLTSLQPNPNNQTSSVSNEYYTAHNNGYVVKASVNNCIWSLEAMEPTANAGIIYCELTDKTVNKSTGFEIPASSLPYGWSRNGK